jgi:hypothetical protein
MALIASQASQTMSFIQEREGNCAIRNSSGNAGVVIYLKDHEIGLFSLREVHKGCIL